MLAAGDRAPEFSLKSTDSTQTTLSSILSAGPVLLAFYKVGCPTCQLTLPFLERISKGELRVVAISQDDAAATQRFAKTYGVTVPTLLDQSKEGYPASNAYGLTNVPSLFLVEKDGAISQAGHGFSKQEIEGLGLRSGVKVFTTSDKVPLWQAG